MKFQILTDYLYLLIINVDKISKINQVLYRKSKSDQ